jgi:hypothetical protein
MFHRDIVRASEANEAAETSGSTPRRNARSMQRLAMRTVHGASLSRIAKPRSSDRSPVRVRLAAFYPVSSRLSGRIGTIGGFVGDPAPHAGMAGPG